MKGTKRVMKPGDKVRVIGSYSEVMCHFRLAGRPVEIELIRREYDGGSVVYHSAQVYKDGKPFSGPITTGEAGIYGSGREDDPFYTYEADPQDNGDEDPNKVLDDTRRLIDDAIASSGVQVTTITNLGL